MNVKTAFLSGNLDEEINMGQGSYKKGKKKQYLKKSIYRLTEDSYQWYIKFNHIIISFRFIENTIDQYIYIYEGLWEQIYIFNIHVHDILLPCNDTNPLKETKSFYFQEL